MFIIHQFINPRQFFHLSQFGNVLATTHNILATP